LSGQKGALQLELQVLLAIFLSRKELHQDLRHLGGNFCWAIEEQIVKMITLGNSSSGGFTLVVYLGGFYEKLSLSLSTG
jgi:hypothetical protein